MTATSEARPQTERERSAARSREAILDAAERLFADKGYEATSLVDVGREAGLSRATPTYFFGSKADLYRAVLERSFADVRTAVRTGRERTRARPHAPEAVLAGAISDYFDFLAARPNFVRLIEREALGSGPGLDVLPPRLAAGQEALVAIVDELGLQTGEGQQGDQAAHFLVSLVALCWFPLVHAGTLVRSVGLDPDAPGFAEHRKRHLTELILRGVSGMLSRSDPASPSPSSSTGTAP